MALYPLSVILMVAFASTAMGQQTCPIPTQAECFYTGAATRTPSAADPNLYFVVGGLFDVHQKGDSAYECGTMVSQSGIINVLAFFWAIEQYVYDILRTSQVSVGAVAFDSCMRREQSIENILSYAQCRLLVQGMLRENLVAYIGPYTNADASMTGVVAKDLHITLLSPSANAMDLNFQDQQTLILMSPSFVYELQGIVEFLVKVKSEYVIIVYSSTDMFWKAAYEKLITLMNMKSNPVCAEYSANYDAISISELVSNLTTRREVKYIVPLLPRSKVRYLMSNVTSSNIPGGSFLFVLTSEIGKDREFLTGSVTANNTVIIDKQVLLTSNKLQDFIAFINKIPANSTSNFMNSVTNPWLEQYLQQAKLPDLSAVTTASPLLHSALNTIISVEAVIRGLASAMTSICGSSGFCSQLRNQLYKENYLYQPIKNALGLHMDNSGDLKYVNVRLDYWLYVISNVPQQEPEFRDIGDLTVSNNGTVTAAFTLDFASYGNVFGPSACPANGQNECCGKTATTTTASIVTATMSSTTTTSSKQEGTKANVTYPMAQAITGAYADDERPDSEYGTRFDIGHKWIIALGVLAGLGILCVIVFEIYILYKLLGTRAGSKWRTMWLGQLLLFGIFLCYLVLFAYLPVPTKATCGITRFGVGVSYAICFAVLLVKLMVILTSRPSDVLLPGDVETPNYLKGIYQFLMFIFAVGVQVVIDIQWLITVPPEAIKVTSNRGDKVWICNHYTWEAGKDMTIMSAFVRTNFENHLMSLIYIMIMILITTILALNAHGIITNHRESVFIGIAAGFSIPIWLAWGLVGGLNKDHEYAEQFGDACIAFGLLLTATLILFSMFLPKVRQLVNMGIEGIYLEDDRDTFYAGSVIMAPPSYKSKGPGSVIYVNNQGIYSEPVVISNGDPMATHLKHPGSTYSAPAYIKRPDSNYGGSTRVLRVTDDLRGHPPKKRAQSEVAYGTSGRPRSTKGTLPRSRSQTNLGAL